MTAEIALSRRDGLLQSTSGVRFDVKSTIKIVASLLVRRIKFH
jgi:hypothetical protein